MPGLILTNPAMATVVVVVVVVVVVAVVVNCCATRGKGAREGAQRDESHAKGEDGQQQGVNLKAVLSYKKVQPEHTHVPSASKMAHSIFATASPTLLCLCQFHKICERPSRLSSTK